MDFARVTHHLEVHIWQINDCLFHETIFLKKILHDWGHKLDFENKKLLCHPPLLQLL